MQAQSPDQQSEASGDSFSRRQPGCAIHFPIMLRRDTVDKLPKISPVEQLYRYMWRRKVCPALRRGSACFWTSEAEACAFPMGMLPGVMLEAQLLSWAMLQCRRPLHIHVLMSYV